MRLSYKSVLNWVESEAKNCSTRELEYLSGMVEVALDQAKTRESATRYALEQAEVAAQKAGYQSLEALLNATGRSLSPSKQPIAATNQNGRQLAPPRKPYMDPMSPADSVKAYAVYKNRAMPPELQKRIDEGWDLSEMSFRRISAARKARGFPPNEPYDPIQKHAELMAAEPPRYRRA